MAAGIPHLGLVVSILLAALVPIPVDGGLKIPPVQGDAAFYAHHGCLPSEGMTLEIGSRHLPLPCRSAAANFRRQVLTFARPSCSFTVCDAVAGAAEIRRLSSVVSGHVAAAHPGSLQFPAAEDLARRRVALDFGSGGKFKGGFSTQLVQIVVSLVLGYVLEIPTILPAVTHVNDRGTEFVDVDISEWFEVAPILEAARALQMDVLYPAPPWARNSTGTEQHDLRVESREYLSDLETTPQPFTSLPDGEMRMIFTLQGGLAFSRVTMHVPTPEWVHGYKLRNVLDPGRVARHANLSHYKSMDSDTLLSGNVRTVVAARPHDAPPLVLNVMKRVGVYNMWVLKTPIECAIARHLLAAFHPTKAVAALVADVGTYLNSLADKQGLEGWGVLKIRSEVDAQANQHNKTVSLLDWNLEDRGRLERLGYGAERLGRKLLYVSSGHDEYSVVKRAYAGYNLVTKQDFPSHLHERVAALKYTERAGLDYFLSVMAPMFISLHHQGASNFPRTVALHRRVLGRSYDLVYPRGIGEEEFLNVFMTRFF